MKNIPRLVPTPAAAAIEKGIMHTQYLTDDKKLPAPLRKEAAALVAKLQGYKLPGKKALPFKTIGHVLTKEQMLSIAEKATGYKWKIAKATKNNNTTGEDPDPIMLLNTWNVEVDKKDMTGYVLSRNAKDRSELFWIEIICIPGYSYMMWQTDRVSGDFDMLIANPNLKSFIEKI